MRKILYSLLFSLFTFCLSAQEMPLGTEFSSEGWKKDSTWSWYYNTSTASWMRISRSLHSYDPEGKIIATVYIHWDYQNSEWINYSKHESEYYTSDTLAKRYEYRWNNITRNWYEKSHSFYLENRKISESKNLIFNDQHVLLAGELITADYPPQTEILLVKVLDMNTSNWVNHERLTRNYDAENHMITSLGEVWNPATLAWVNTMKWEIAYDAEGRKTEEIQYEWNNILHVWTRLMKIAYLYNSSGWNTSIIMYGWDAPLFQWKQSDRQTMIYDEFGKLMQTNADEWDDIMQIWKYRQKSVNTYYPGGQRKETTRYVWVEAVSDFKIVDYALVSPLGYTEEEYSLSVSMQNGSYYQGYRTLNTYSNDLLQVTLGQTYDVNTATWTDESRKTYTYDANRNSTEELFEYVNNGSWVLNGKEQHFYSSIIGIGEKTEVTTSCIFSNPIRPGDRITCPDLDKGATLTLLNLNGQRVFSTTLPGDGSVSIPSSISSGMYILELKDGTRITSGKIIIL